MSVYLYYMQQNPESKMADKENFARTITSPPLYPINFNLFFVSKSYFSSDPISYVMYNIRSLV